MSDPDVPRAPASGRAAIVLTVLASSALLVNFIETMLVPALPNLVSFFGGVPYTTVAWILSAYLLVGVCTTPVFAKLGDIYGKRRILLVVLGVYAIAVAFAPFTPLIGSALGVTRPDQIYLLIAVRALQGLGLAMFPLAFAMIGEELPAARVGPAQGVVASMFAAGAAAGILGGAWLIHAFGWQVAYGLVVVPAAALAIAAGRLPESRHRLAARLDIPGAALLGGTLGTFLLGLTLGPTWGWGNWTGGERVGIPFGVPELFVLAPLLLVGFYLRERSAAQPIFNLSRFRERNLGLSYTIAFLVGTSLFLAFVTLTILVELPVVGLGRSILDFGLASLPTTLSTLAVAPIVGVGVARAGPRPMMLVGALSAATGFLLLLEFHATYLEMVVEAVPTFAGLVALIVSTTNVVVLSAREGETGIQTGMTEMLQDLGSSVAPVLVTAILASVTTTYSVAVSTPSGSLVAHVPGPAPAAFQILFGIGLAMSILAGILGSLIRNYRFPADAPEAARRAAAAPAPTEG